MAVAERYKPVAMAEATAVFGPASRKEMKNHTPKGALSPLHPRAKLNLRPRGRPPIINDSGYSSVVPVSSKDYSIIFNRNNEKQATSNNS